MRKPLAYIILLLITWNQLANCQETTKNKTTSKSSTELVLTINGKNGKPITSFKAEIHLEGLETPNIPSIHGVHGVSRGVKIVELPARGNKLILPLGENWLRSRLPSYFKDSLNHAYLYIEAKGYAPIRTEPFFWIGTVTCVKCDRANTVTIKFPFRPEIKVNEGERVNFDLVLRKIKDRYIKFVDDNGKAVHDVKVRSYIHGTHRGHCGIRVGAVYLADGTSNSNGLLNTPDGEFTYAFDFHKPSYQYKSPPNGWVELIGPSKIYLTDNVTTFKLNKIRRVPLELIVTRNGKPVKGLIPYGWLAGCPCGACDGPLKMSKKTKGMEIFGTDENGKIKIPDFSPDQCSRIFLKDDGKSVWHSDLNATSFQMPKTGVLKIKLNSK